MPLSYVSDNKGNTIAVQIPIDEWNRLKQENPGFELLQNGLPQWQKDLIDLRLQAIADNPERLRPIAELYEELENDTEG